MSTLSFGKVAHLTFMHPVARFMLWVAVAAWVLVAAAFIVRLARHREEPATPAPSPSAAAARDGTTERDPP
ncbi:MAG TPA: hypothetical protein VHF26_10435 [Trebonia sp.]|nr:hypothetical protein [Trebonia sp.]